MTLFFLTFIVTVNVVFAEFNYDLNDPEGPLNWAKKYKNCGGKYQSPIDIETANVTRVSLPPLHFFGFHQLPETVMLINNGHTVQVEITTSEPVGVSGGPLRGNYSFKQFHFHWGVNDSFGSENTINKRSFSMELHIVCFNTKYGSFENSLEHRDGLAVFAVLIEATDDENRAFTEVIDNLPKVIEPNSSIELRYQLPLEFLLPKEQVHYFTHYGSLTTPPCSEIVTWVEFKRQTHMSHKQVKAFRTIKGHHGLLTHNTRPLQPANDREVYYNYADNYGSQNNDWSWPTD